MIIYVIDRNYWTKRTFVAKTELEVIEFLMQEYGDHLELTNNGSIQDLIEVINDTVETDEEVVYSTHEVEID